MGQRGAVGAYEAEDVDVEDALPLGVVVVLHGAGGAYTRVADHGLEPAQFVRRAVDGGPHRRVVGDVRLQREHALECSFGVPVEYGHPRAPFHQQRRDGGPDAGGSPGDERGDALEVACGVRKPAHQRPSCASWPSWPWRGWA